MGMKIKIMDKMLNQHRGMFRVEKIKTLLIKKQTKISILISVKHHIARTEHTIKKD